MGVAIATGRIPDSEKERVQALYEDGKTLPDIARIYRVGYGTTHKFFVKHNIPRRDGRGKRGKMVVDKGRTCTRCCETKPLDHFYRWHNGKRNNSYVCIECKRDTQGKTKIAKDHGTDWVFHSAKLSQEDYEELLRRQNGRCAICGQPHRGRGIKSVLHVDHCHDTGIVRGLLCLKCNWALGQFNSIEKVQRALDYCEKFAPSEGQIELPLTSITESAPTTKRLSHHLEKPDSIEEFLATESPLTEPSAEPRGRTTQGDKYRAQGSRPGG